VASATYNAANHQVTFGATTLTYDLNGNLTGDGTTTYTWNARNQLVGISGGTSFVYDAAGRRQSKTLGGTTTAFLHDGLNPVQEQAGTTLTNLLTGLGIDEFYRRTDGTTAETFFTDALGTTVALTDGSGTITASYTYEAFGATAVTGTTTNAYDYTGRESDGTGLKYYRARYYHPGLQRFISEDPIRLLSGDPNFYAYVGNDPLDFIDPLGLDKDCAFADVSSSTPLQIATDAAAGFGDAVSLGLTSVTRQLVGIDGQVRRNCGLYIAAEVAGIGWLIATNVVGGVTGAEITIGKWRFAPWGNRTGHPTGERPHYHRGRPDPNRPGDSLPGQGKGRHRPWDTKPQDRSFWDRF
jgi:RHS repeat-associated protein